MKSISRAILIGFTLLALSFQAHAFRCGSSIIDIGDRKYRVLKLCGEPTYIDAYDRTVGVYPFQFIHVEVWTYNFGKYRFIQELEFEYGMLKRINSLEYGY